MKIFILNLVNSMKIKFGSMINLTRPKEMNLVNEREIHVRIMTEIDNNRNNNNSSSSSRAPQHIIEKTIVFTKGSSQLNPNIMIT